MFASLPLSPEPSSAPKQAAQEKGAFSAVLIRRKGASSLVPVPDAQGSGSLSECAPGNPSVAPALALFRPRLIQVRDPSTFGT